MNQHVRQRRPKVSVIVPVYNVEPYLEECLDSICNQTLREIEILCVNDGSTDESPSILAQYAERDCRIQILHQENQGLSAARNAGVRMSCGQYLYFCDSDDYIERDALQYLYAMAEQYEAQLIFFNHIPFADDGVDSQRLREARTYAHRWGGYSAICSGSEMMKQMLRNGGWIVTAWGSMIRHDYFLEKQLEFPVGLLYEDNLYTFQATFLADRVCYAPRALYHYRIRKDSIMSRHPAWKSMKSYFATILGVTNILNSAGESEEYREIAEAILRPLIWHLKKSYKEVRQEEAWREALFGERMLMECWNHGAGSQGVRKLQLSPSELQQTRKCLCAQNEEDAHRMVHRFKRQMLSQDVIAIYSAPSLYGTLLDGHVVCSPEAALHSGYMFVVGREVPAWLEGQDVVSLEELI